ncbi:MAG: DUF4364 family protein [Clostridia bacterium]|nr:DUF4364 family protein [Clostridia bacterium]
MDYFFNDETDVRLITLFIIDGFKMPVPSSYVFDVIMLQPVVNYFDISSQLSELCEKELVTYYTEKETTYYSLTTKGAETLSYFKKRIPLTVRERFLNTIKLKIKELKNSLSIKSEYNKLNDIEYNVSLGIFEGAYELFSVSLSVGDEKTAQTMCGSFKSDPQKLYSQILSTLLNKEDVQ